MPAPSHIALVEKMPAILGRINPIIDELNVNASAVADLETAVDDIISYSGPDLVILFENGLV